MTLSSAHLSDRGVSAEYFHLVVLRKVSRIIYLPFSRSRDNSVGIATCWNGLVRYPAMQSFSLFHSVQTGSGVHPTFYPMGKATKKVKLFL
jgi:hypothetical protein